MNKTKLRKLNHQFNKNIKDKPLLLNLYLKVVPLLNYFYFKNERLAYKGKNLSKSNHKSILFFTSQKCASTFLSDLLVRLVSVENMIPIRYSNYFPDVDRASAFKDENFLKRGFKPKGYFYGAFRSYHSIPNINNYKVLLVLRDPRDVVTSSYFSTAFNHPVTRKDTLKKREKALKQDIDTFVREQTPFFLEGYREYCKHLVGKENVLFLTYEDMITDFNPWLLKMVKHLNLEVDDSLIGDILNNTSFTVKKEDKNSFVRNIKAGDHLNKLKPETIQWLNKEFKDVITTLGYQPSLLDKLT